MDPGIVAGAVAFVCGYAVGALPVAWLLVRRRTGLDLRQRGSGGTASIDALRVAGVRTAALALVLELVKGAAVGLAARLYSPSGWFIAAAIAGCVVGDAFPVGFRRGGRGLAPLVSGLFVALPTAGAVTAIAAVPAALFTSMRGRIYDAVVLIAVPFGLLVGTRQWQSLVPAAVIAGALLLRAGLRRRRLRETDRLRGQRPPMVIDAGDAAVPVWRPMPEMSRQNRSPWDS
jgi:glycerol-3-phosphate acyltransferase PlsY